MLQHCRARVYSAHVLSMGRASYQVEQQELTG